MGGRGTPTHPTKGCSQSRGRRPLPVLAGYSLTPVRGAHRYACWDMSLCTSTTHRAMLTPFPQCTSPHPTMYSHLHANVCAHTCGHWTQMSSPSACHTQSLQVPGHPNPSASLTILHHCSQGLRATHACPRMHYDQETHLTAPHYCVFSQPLVMGAHCLQRWLCCQDCEDGTVALPQRSGARTNRQMLRGSQHGGT